MIQIELTGFQETQLIKAKRAFEEARNLSQNDKAYGALHGLVLTIEKLLEQGRA